MIQVHTSDLIDIFQLEVVSGKAGIERLITDGDLYRPGLILAGFFDIYPAERIQVLGTTELSFFENLDPSVKYERMEKLCAKETPCIIVTRELAIPKELLKASEMHGVPLLRSKVRTTKLISQITNYLEGKLARALVLHGVLVDVYGIGVLLTGKSGVGKSETALELIKRGHQLVADDCVEVSQIDYELIGTGPEILRHLLEIRGIGILDVMTMFGARAVRTSKTVELVINLEAWDRQKDYERLGLDEEKIKYFDTEIPKITIPVSPGRNLAVITEVAAMNHRLKTLGINAAQQLADRMTEAMKASDSSSQIE